jgi:hypothetical protein
MDGSPQCGLLQRNHPMALDAAEWAPSTASLADAAFRSGSWPLRPRKRALRSHVECYGRNRPIADVRAFNGRSGARPKGNDVLSIKPTDHESARVLSRREAPPRTHRSADRRITSSHSRPTRDGAREYAREYSSCSAPEAGKHYSRPSYAARLHMTETPCQSGAYSVVPPQR